MLLIANNFTVLRYHNEDLQYSFRNENVDATKK